MSDLIARTEAQIDLLVLLDKEAGAPFEDRWRRLFARAAAALRKKDEQVAREHETAVWWEEALYQAQKKLRAAEAQISALRDQQPVAWEVANCAMRYATVLPPHEDKIPPDSKVTPLYAHPSCVYPDQQQEK